MSAVVDELYRTIDHRSTRVGAPRRLVVRFWLVLVACRQFYSKLQEESAGLDVDGLRVHGSRTRTHRARIRARQVTQQKIGRCVFVIVCVFSGFFEKRSHGPD